MEIIQLGVKLRVMNYLRSSTYFFALSLTALMICAASEAAPVDPAPVDTDKQWAADYKKAEAHCKAFAKFSKETAPTPEIQAVVDLRYEQKCKKNDNVLKNLKFEWLKRDAVLNGMRETKDPETFTQYYEAFLKLDVQARASLEYLERANLFRKNIKKVNQKTQKELFEKMLSMFPAFYVEYKKDVPKGKLFEAAYGLRMQRKFSNSRKIYNQILDSSKRNLVRFKSVKSKAGELSDIYKAYDYIRLTYRIQENRPRSIVEFRKGYKFIESYVLGNPKKEFTKYYTDTVVQLARDMWTQGQVDAAKKLLLNTVKRAPKKASLDQVYWVLGRMDQENKNYAGAVEYFEKALKEDPDHDFRLKLLWLVAWNAKKNGQPEKAIDGLEELESKSKSPDDDSYRYKSLFWQAQLYKDLNKDEKAKKLLTKVAEENTWGYYGRAALLEVKPEAYEQGLSTEIKHEENDVIDPLRERTIHTLLAMNEPQILSEYLNDLWKSIGKRARKKTATRIQFLSWAHESELYKENQQILEIFEEDSKKELFEKVPSFFFPMPYLDVVEKYAKKFKVPQEITYAIMRQESLFDKKARSQADAFGLLQLLPRVASKHMDEAGIQFKNPEELYDPAVILPLGIAHLRQLLNIFDGSMVLAAASYNAGVSPVKGWLKSRYNNNSYEFIEDIPYLETEHYAKLVFRNLSFYAQFDKNLDGKSKIELLKNYFEIKEKNTQKNTEEKPKKKPKAS